MVFLSVSSVNRLVNNWLQFSWHNQAKSTIIISGWRFVWMLRMVWFVPLTSIIGTVPLSFLMVFLSVSSVNRLVNNWLQFSWHNQAKSTIIISGWRFVWMLRMVWFVPLTSIIGTVPLSFYTLQISTTSVHNSFCYFSQQFMFLCINLIHFCCPGSGNDGELCHWKS